MCQVIWPLSGVTNRMTDRREQWGSILQNARQLLSEQVALGLQVVPQCENVFRGKTIPSPQQRSLESLERSLAGCQRCKLHRQRTHIVFGVGNPQARLMFIGEGPGRDEDIQGEPFVGAAGQLLNKMIVAMGFTRDDVYIANIVKCRPPRNRNPEPDEIAQCEPFLWQQIQQIKPVVVVALGRFASQSLLGVNTPISKLRGCWQQYRSIPLMPTFHPAYLLRNAAEKRHAWHDLQAVMRQLET